jgi:hypothetical protein
MRPIWGVLKKNDGFALVAGLFTLLILLGLATLIYVISTKDIRTAVRTTGEQKAMAGVESGIHMLLQQSNLSVGAITSYTATDVPVSGGGDSDTKYSIGPPTITVGSSIPRSLCFPGYSCGSTGNSRSFRQTNTPKSVTGKNTRYGSEVTVDIGVGFGPVEVSTGQPAAGG